VSPATSLVARYESGSNNVWRQKIGCGNWNGELRMHYRTLGRTGLKVGIIGFGAWGIGKGLWVGAEDDVSLRALHAARDAGVNFFDTALAYGMGHTEELLKRAFGRSDDVASKVQRRWQ